jgi:hypothetical protein
MSLLSSVGTMAQTVILDIWEIEFETITVAVCGGKLLSSQICEEAQIGESWSRLAHT